MELVVSPCKIHCVFRSDGGLCPLRPPVRFNGRSERAPLSAGLGALFCRPPRGGRRAPAVVHGQCFRRQIPSACRIESDCGMRELVCVAERDYSGKSILQTIRQSHIHPAINIEGSSSDWRSQKRAGRTEYINSARLDYYSDGRPIRSLLASVCLKSNADDHGEA